MERIVGRKGGVNGFPKLFYETLVVTVNYQANLAQLLAQIIGFSKTQYTWRVEWKYPAYKHTHTNVKPLNGIRGSEF